MAAFWRAPARPAWASAPRLLTRALWLGLGLARPAPLAGQVI